MRRYGGLSRVARTRRIIPLARGICGDCTGKVPPANGAMIGNCDRCGVGLCAGCFFTHKCNGNIGNE